MGSSTSATCTIRNDPFFSKLPTEWIISFLSNWLDIKDVANLDTAMTMHSKRPAFLQILNGMRSTSISRKYDFDSFPMLCWLSIRGIYVEDIELNTNGSWRQGKHRDCLKMDQLKILNLVSLRKLVIHHVDDLGIFYAIRHSPRLQSLTIDDHEFSKDIMVQTDLGLHCIGSLCPALEHFSLTRNGPTADALCKFFRESRLLKTVKLIGGVLRNFSASDIECLRPFGHLFEALSFPHRHPVTSSSPPSVGRMKAFAELLAHCPNLKVLDFQNSWEVQYSHEGQDDLVLVSLAQHCPLVEEIRLRQTLNCPDAGLSLLRQNCKNLVKIHFEECGSLTEACFEHIAKIQSLQHVSFNNLDTGAGVAALMRGCPNLREFHIYDPSLRSAAGFRGLKDAPFVDSLVDIDIAIGEMEDEDETDQFDVIIGEGLARCHNLVKIAVSNDDFGDVGLALMCAGCLELEELVVDQSGNLTIEGLMHVATKCPRLRRCEVCSFHEEFQFSDAEVEMFEARFPAIKLVMG